MKRRSRRNPAIAGALLANPRRRARRARRSTRRRNALGHFVSTRRNPRRKARRNPYIGMSKRHPGRVVANVSKRATVTPRPGRPNIIYIQDHPRERAARAPRRRRAHTTPAPVKGAMHGPRKPRRHAKPGRAPVVRTHTGAMPPPFATLPSQQRKNPFGDGGPMDTLIMALVGTVVTIGGLKLIPMIAGKLLGFVKQPATDEKGQRTLTADLVGLALAGVGIYGVSRFVRNEKYRIGANSALGIIALLPLAKRAMEKAKPGSAAGLLGEDAPLRFDFTVQPSVSGALRGEYDDLTTNGDVDRLLTAAANNQEEMLLPIIQGSAAGDELTMPVIQGSAAGDELTMPVIQGDGMVFGDDRSVFGEDRNVFGDDRTIFGDSSAAGDELDMPVIQ